MPHGLFCPSVRAACAELILLVLVKPTNSARIIKADRSTERAKAIRDREPVWEDGCSV